MESSSFKEIVFSFLTMQETFKEFASLVNCESFPSNIYFFKSINRMILRVLN